MYFFQIIEENLTSIKDQLENDFFKKLIRQYQVLVDLINDKTGEFVDPFLNSSLDFQYHYNFIFLSFLLTSPLFEKKNQKSKIIKTFKYWLRLSDTIVRPSLEFNNFALCLIYSIYKYTIESGYFEQYIEDLLEARVKNLNHRTYQELIPLNNNFKALTAINLFLQGFLIKDGKKVSSGIDLMKRKVVNFQMNDGFFPDTNMNQNHYLEKNQGVPNLTYHCKITMLVALLASISDDTIFKDSAIRAIDNLMKIVPFDGESCFYGRTQNALFGYASLFLGLCLVYKFIKRDKKYLIFSNKILKLILSYQLPNGLISINLNKGIKQRFGYDSYMFSVVYNAYSNALFLLGIIINPEVISVIKVLEDLSPQLVYFKNSGFFKIKDHDLEFCFNARGHINCYKYYNDSRLSPTSLLYLKFKQVDLIPSIPMKSQLVSTRVLKPRLLDKIAYHFKNFNYNIAIGGFIPYFQEINFSSRIIPILNNITKDYFLNELKDIIYTEGLIELNYSLKQRKNSKKRITRTGKLLKIFQKKYLKSLKAKISLSWKKNQIRYTISGPSKMFCIFPLRFYEDSNIQKVNKNSIILNCKKITLNIKTNLNFKLLNSVGRFSSGKGKTKLLFLKFYQSENLKINILMKK